MKKLNGVKVKIKAYIRRLKKKGLSNLEVLEKLHKIKPYTMWEGINIVDYLNKKYHKI